MAGKRKATEISESDFIERFKPEEDADGCVYFERDWSKHEDAMAITKADAERRLWTMVEGDRGEPALLQGHHYVNRLYHVICQNPCPDGEEVLVLMD